MCASRPLIMGSAICSYCGEEFRAAQWIINARMKRNGGEVYCGVECGSAGSALTQRKSEAAAIEAGVMKCNICKQEKPLEQFRLKVRPGARFKYTRVCLLCDPESRAGDSRRSPRMDSDGGSQILLRTTGMAPEEIIDIHRCDHTPIFGPNERAPDWRVLKRTDGHEYKWSCCICGYSHKTEAEARACCTPRVVMHRDKFYTFEEWEARTGRSYAQIQGAERSGL